MRRRKKEKKGRAVYESAMCQSVSGQDKSLHAWLGFHSYSVGQKVMPTGFKSHWKGPSCSARYSLSIFFIFLKIFLKKKILDGMSQSH